MGRTIARHLLAVGLVVAGFAHLLAWRSFLAQVPPWMPFARAVILVSGLIEIVLAIALIAAKRQRRQMGVIVAIFFVLVFPGNISQWVTQTDGFGLDTDRERLIRLFAQPFLVYLAWWSTRPASNRVQQTMKEHR